MALSVADIGQLALDGVARGISGVIHTCTVTRQVRGAYNVTTGEYVQSSSSQAGRALEDASKPVRDVFPDYEVGPSDKMVLLEGLNTVPEETHKLFYNGRNLTIMAVADVAGGGGLYYVMAR